MTDIATALAALDARLAEIGGCGDGCCMVHIRGGMHTNGGCRCLRDWMTAQRVVGAYKQFVAVARRCPSPQEEYDLTRGAALEDGLRALRSRRARG